MNGNRGPDVWDERYATAEYVWKTAPNQFLPDEVARLAPGAALDLACGEGRNSVWLATQGWRVVGVDFSSVGLAKAERLALEHGAEVEWICADVTDWQAPAEFDLVILFYLQLPAAGRRAAVARATHALAPGGTLLVVAHDSSNLTDGVGGPQDPAVLYVADDLRADLAECGVVDLEIERAERVYRDVEVDGVRRVAIDCLLRARRSDA